MGLNPIQTVYKGYRFRSRLEARWAVFLDSLNIKWQYEHEGFDLGGTWYLPDFYLPGQSPAAWFEVKPKTPDTEQDKEALITKAFELCRRSKEHVIVILGDPFPGEYVLMFVAYNIQTNEVVAPLLGQNPSHRVIFAESDCGAIHVAHYDAETGEVFVTIRIREETRPCPSPGNCMMRLYKSDEGVRSECPDLWLAFSRARQARFEFGETPK